MHASAQTEQRRTLARDVGVAGKHAAGEPVKVGVVAKQQRIGGRLHGLLQAAETQRVLSLGEKYKMLVHNERSWSNDSIRCSAPSAVPKP